jgi:hypothetical protein
MDYIDIDFCVAHSERYITKEIRRKYFVDIFLKNLKTI